MTYPDIGFALLTASAGNISRMGEISAFQSPYDEECRNRIFLDRSGGFAPKTAHAITLSVFCNRECWGGKGSRRCGTAGRRRRIAKRVARGRPALTLATPARADRRRDQAGRDQGDDRRGQPRGVPAGLHVPARVDRLRRARLRRRRRRRQ